MPDCLIGTVWFYIIQKLKAPLGILSLSSDNNIMYINSIL